jgi:hypothetical protein
MTTLHLRELKNECTLYKRESKQERIKSFMFLIIFSVLIVLYEYMHRSIERFLNVLGGVWEMGNGDYDEEMKGEIDLIPCLDDGK